MTFESRTRVRLHMLTKSRLWAIEDSALAELVAWALPQPGGSPSAGHDRGWTCAKPSFMGPKQNRTAVIPIEGVLTQSGPGWMGSNYADISEAAENATMDPSIKQIVLAVDSPGGEVTGLPETAAIIAHLAKAKPVHAIVEGMSASAAYWLTSQANDIQATPSGEVGSVGVRMMHADISKMLDDAGVKVTELFSGAYKTEWSPFKPLSEAAQENMMERLNAVHADFISAVAAGRGNRASADIQAARFGEGRMLSAKDAQKAGMVDGLQTSRDFYKAIFPHQEETASPEHYGLPSRARLEIAKRRL